MNLTLKGYRSYLCAAALGAKGMLGMTTGVTPDGVALEPATTFENFDAQLRKVAEGAPSSGGTRSQGLTDLLLGGAVAALRVGVKKE